MQEDTADTVLQGDMADSLMGKLCKRCCFAGRLYMADVQGDCKVDTVLQGDEQEDNRGAGQKDI